MKPKYDAVTIFMALALCGAATLISGCALSTEVMLRPVHSYKAQNATYDRPLKCLLGNFEGCRNSSEAEVQGS